MNHPFQDKRIAGLAVGALVLLFAAGGALLLRRGPAPEPEAPQIFVPPPTDADHLLPSTQEPENRLPGEVSAQIPESEALTFGQFIDLLSDSAEKPEIASVAAVVKDKFEAEPELKALYAEFKEKHKDEKGSAEKFFKEARELPAFKRLVSEFTQQRGASGAVQAIMATPGLRAFATQQYAALVGKGKGVGRTGPLKNFEGAKALDADAIAKEWARKGVSGVKAPGGSGAPGTSAEIGGGTHHGGAGAGPGGAPADPSKQQAAGGTTPLGEIGRGTGKKEDEQDHVFKEWLRKYGLNPDAYLAARDEGIWDTCFRRGLSNGRELAMCQLACQHPPQAIMTRVNAVCAYPSDPTFWATCLDVVGSESGCLKECSKQEPPCQLPRDVIRRLCDPPNMAPPDANCRYLASWNKPQRQCKLLDLDPTRMRPSYIGPNGESGTGYDGQNCRTVPNTRYYKMPDGRESCYSTVGECPRWGCEGNLAGFRAYQQCVADGGLP